MKFVLVPELRGRWTWELRSVDGQAAARSAMSFSSPQQALTSIQAFRNVVPGLSVEKAGGKKPN
jgi:hypothetical protein